MKLLRLRPMQANVAVAVVGMLRQEAAGTQQAVHRTARPSSRASTRGHTSCTQLAGPDDGSILTLSAVQRRPGDLFKALGTEGPAEVRGFLLADRAWCFVIRKAPCACESPEAWIQATLSRTWCLGTSEQQCRIACRSSCRRGMPTPRGLTYCDATPADELKVWLHGSVLFLHGLGGWCSKCHTSQKPQIRPRQHKRQHGMLRNDTPCITPTTREGCSDARRAL